MNLVSTFNNPFFIRDIETKAYLELRRTFTMLFFLKSFTVDAWLGSKYAYEKVHVKVYDKL